MPAVPATSPWAFRKNWMLAEAQTTWPSLCFKATSKLGNAPLFFQTGLDRPTLGRVQEELLDGGPLQDLGGIVSPAFR